jgi:hypothetical protein
MSMTKDELVDALRQASKAGYFGGMGGGSGGSGTGSGTSSGSGFAGAGDKLSKEFSAAGGAAKGLGEAALGAGSKIAEGGAKLGDVTDALRQGFAGLGAQGSVLGTALEKGAKGLDALGQNVTQNVETWRKLSDTGLSFGNDIMAMKDQASAARLSIAEMSEVLQKNNSAMLGFGATSAESAKKLSKMSNEFFTSGLGEQLRGMGYTTKELNEVLAVSISGSKLKDLKDKDGQDRSLKAAASLATEMDAVAKITGQSKQEQLDELRRKATDGQRMAAIDEAIARGGEGAKEAFDAISANGKLMGPQFQKLAEDMASMGRPSEGMEQAYGLLSSGAKKLMSEAGEAARSGDRERAAQLTKQAAAEQAAFQQTSQYRTMAAQAGIKETQESYAQGAKFRNALADAGGNINNVEESMKKLDEQVKKEQQAGGKDDPNASAGASITRFAVDLESRGRDLTKVLNDEVIQKLAKDVAPKIRDFSKAFDLGSSTVVQDKLQKPIAAGYDKGRLSRIVNEEAGDKSGPNTGVGKSDAAAKDVKEFNALINGNQKQSDAALKVIEKIANEKSTTKEDLVKSAMANKGAGMADLVSQIKKELPANEQLGYKEEQKSKLEKQTGKLVSPGNEPSALEGVGRGIELAGGLFRNTPGNVNIVGGLGARAVGGVVTKPEISLIGEAGPEAIFNKGQLEEYTAKIMRSATDAMPKLDMTSISKTISTSISSVTGGGSTTRREVQNDDSKKAQQELLALEKSQREEKQKLVNQLKEEGTIKGKFATASDHKNIPELAALMAKQSGERDVLTKRVDAGTSMETVVEQAKEQTTKMVTEQLAITKSNSGKLTDLLNEDSKNKLATTKKDVESLSDMYKDDSKNKLDLAKKTNAETFKEAELAKSVIGTSVKGMSDDMIEAMIPKGAKIEDYYIDMNDKIQSNSADYVANMEKNAKASASVIESYSITVSSSSKKISADIADALPVKEMAAKQEEFKSQFTESQQKIIDDYKGYSEENRSFHAQAMESGIKEDTRTAEIIAARISKMKADIGDRQATEEETAELANQEANKKLFERRVEEKKEMLDVMQNLGDYSAKREIELKQKAANDAIAIEDKKAAAIKADINSELPVDNEFGDLDGAIARNKADDEAKSELARESRRGAPVIEDTPKSKMMSATDMMAGGLSFGPNGMPIIKSIDAAKKSIEPAKKPDTSSDDAETAKLKRQQDAKKADESKKSDSKAATKEATLSDVVTALNTLNKQMGQLISVSEDGHKATTKAAKSGASNIYAR